MKFDINVIAWMERKIVPTKSKQNAKAVRKLIVSASEKHLNIYYSNSSYLVLGLRFSSHWKFGNRIVAGSFWRIGQIVPVTLLRNTTF